ncbi:pentapeptide repeat-containing protein [Dactylosporangium sp. NPDC049525]|uniref:pentapeptide repeat-containing protein n=1 Tax=Dactylosporangium sp. NPDC049525 TaxID=3154730 RepID=UPI00343B5EF5
MLGTMNADSWNEWRQSHGPPNLWDADLTGMNLAGRNLAHADLRLANLEGADLRSAVLRKAKLRGARLTHADLRNADLSGADLGKAELEMGDGGLYYVPTVLRGARLAGCNLSAASLIGADLSDCQLVRVDLSNANLDGASVYGTSCWDVDLKGASQRNLRVTRDDQPYITIDRLELAQFIHLIIENAKLRDFLDTVSAKTVLILSRFTDARTEYLDAIRDAVRSKGDIPLVFDFSRPASKDVTGTIEVLARLVKFVVVDLSDPSSVPHELATVVPFMRRTPILPLLDTSASTYSMFNDMFSYPWVLEIRKYESHAELSGLLPLALESAEQTAVELRERT